VCEPPDTQGYFCGFRWDSLIALPKVKVGTPKIVPAKLIKKVAPVYPPDATARGINGVVRVYFVIGGDLKVYLRKAARDAILHWRYEPAALDGKPIETNAVSVDVNFSPKHGSPKQR
jgi:hypothetical protein